MPSHLLRLPQVRHHVGLSRSAIYALIKAGTFPRPIPVGVRARAWDASEIDAWVESRRAKRDAA